MADKLSIQGTKYDLIDYKPSTSFCLKVGNKYAVLSSNKPVKSGYTLKVTNGSTVLYLNNSVKPLSKIKMKRDVGKDKGNNWHWAKFYNKSNQLICTVNFSHDWSTAEGIIDSSISDQSINRCHLYYYQDLSSKGWCNVTADVIDINGSSHRLFYGYFKNHSDGDNVYLGVGQAHNFRLSQNNFPMELKY